MKNAIFALMFFVLMPIYAFVIFTHWRPVIFALGCIVIFGIIVKNDLRKIQAERADLNNQEILDALEKDLRERKKK